MCQKLEDHNGLPIFICGHDHPEYRFKIRTKTVRVEFHPYCGPIVLNADGSVRENQPSSNSPFWDVVQKSPEFKAFYRKARNPTPIEVEKA